MNYTNKTLSKPEKVLLKKAKGEKLCSIDAVLAAPPDNSWNTVRLHFKQFDIDINNYLGEIIVDEFGSLEEFGLLSVTEANIEKLNIPEVGTDTTTFSVNKVIGDIYVINNLIDIYGDGSLVAKLEYPQAVAFDIGSQFIMFDKEVWFSETIVLKRGNDIKEMLYDESVNWEDDLEEDPSTHFEFRNEIIKL